MWPSDARRKVLEQQRDRIVEAIASGTLAEAEAKTKVDQIRIELNDIGTTLDQGRFDERRERLSNAEMAALKARASDFPAQLAKASPNQVRNLLTPWLDGITVDGDARRVTLTLRRLPTSYVCPACRIEAVP